MRAKGDPPSRDGRIITFYSYKGGTGRSMAVANVAWVLASQGRKVMVVDWDLEAPGLHRYFQPYLADPELESPPGGLIDFVTDFSMEMAGAPEEHDADWYVGFADIRRYAASLTWQFPGDGTIDFVSAGRQGPSYAARVNTFDWDTFYEHHSGGVLLEAVRDHMRRHYDYVLIDSRTGVSDTAGVCTVQMPDALVVLFTMNNQSIDGVARVAESVARQRTVQDGFRIWPVPTRIEDGELRKLTRRRRFARARLASLLAHVPAAERDGYWGRVEVPYRTYYAYEEVLAPFVDEPEVPGTVLSAMERLTGFITDGVVERAGPMTEEVRERELARWEATTTPGVDVDPGEVPAPPAAAASWRRWFTAQTLLAGAIVLLLVAAAGVGWLGTERQRLGDDLERVSVALEDSREQFVEARKKRDELEAHEAAWHARRKELEASQAELRRKLERQLEDVLAELSIAEEAAARCNKGKKALQIEARKAAALSDRARTRAEEAAAAAENAQRDLERARGAAQYAQQLADDAEQKAMAAQKEVLVTAQATEDLSKRLAASQKAAAQTTEALDKTRKALEAEQALRRRAEEARQEAEAHLDAADFARVRLEGLLDELRRTCGKARAVLPEVQQAPRRRAH